MLEEELCYSPQDVCGEDSPDEIEEEVTREYPQKRLKTSDSPPSLGTIAPKDAQMVVYVNHTDISVLTIIKDIETSALTDFELSLIL